MRLELGRRADYAVRAAVDLAHHQPDGRRRKSRVIAEDRSIPAGFLPQILADLVRAGLAESVAGRDGGYVLARAPSEITLLEVVRAVKGEPLDATCVLRDGPCASGEICAMHVPWSRAKDALLDALADTSIADLVETDAAIASGDSELPADVVDVDVVDVEVDGRPLDPGAG